ncbi:MAG: hypothetical protein CUN49_18040, partial [Candidatus Thermofonsia Clade 1 bacterium]
LDHPQARVRANALEALESLLSPQLVKLIAPLYAFEGTEAQRTALSQTLSGIQQTAAEFLQQAITDPNDDGLRAIISFALGEIAPPETPTAPLAPCQQLLSREQISALLSIVVNTD